MDKKSKLISGLTEQKITKAPQANSATTTLPQSAILRRYDNSILTFLCTYITN